MIEDIKFKDFCKAHYDEAMKDAEYALAAIVKEKGKMDARMDLEMVKSLAVLSALESAYLHFDPSRGGRLSSFLSLVVRNDLKTELGKESTRVRKFVAQPRKRKTSSKTEDDGEVKVEFSGIMPGVKRIGNREELFEPAVFMDVEGASKGKEMLWRKVLKKLQQLPPVDQTVLMCWMYEEQDDMAYLMDGEKPQRTYVQRAIDELGLPKTTSTNAISLRKFKAVQKLKAMMKGENTDYHDMYVPGSSAQWETICTDNRETVVKIYSDEEYETIGNAFKKKF